MTSLANDYASGVFAGQKPPCLSLYQPTHRHHPQNRQDPIRFRNLLKAIEQSLRQGYSATEAGPILAPFQALAEDGGFWNQTTDGLAAFGARGFFRIYKLQRPVRELALVADSFHTKPLVRIVQSADRYQVLGLNRHGVKLFEGNRHALDEIELHPGVPRMITESLGAELTESHLTVATYGMGAGGPGTAMRHGHGSRKDDLGVGLDTERFFRVVDKAVLEHHSRPSGLRLILAALPENHTLFRRVSRNPFLMREGLDIHPDSLSPDALSGRAWRVVEPEYLARLTSAADEYREARAKERGTDDLAEAARAAASGRVARLLVEADRQVPGRLDKVRGRIEDDDISHPEVGDLLDDVAELVLERGGEVIVAQSERMPSDTGVAATYRF